MSTETPRARLVATAGRRLAASRIAPSTCIAAAAPPRSSLRLAGSGSVTTSSATHSRATVCRQGIRKGSARTASRSILDALSPWVPAWSRVAWSRVASSRLAWCTVPTCMVHGPDSCAAASRSGPPDEHGSSRARPHRPQQAAASADRVDEAGREPLV
eukprot:3927729-Prymnesium_polylepis.1